MKFGLNISLNTSLKLPAGGGSVSLPTTLERQFALPTNIPNYNHSMLPNGDFIAIPSGSFTMYEISSTGTVINQNDIRNGASHYPAACYFLDPGYLVFFEDAEYKELDASYVETASGTVTNLDGSRAADIQFIGSELHIANDDQIVVYDLNYNYLRTITLSDISFDTQEIGIYYSGDSRFVLKHNAAGTMVLSQYESDFSSVADEVNLESIDANMSNICAAKISPDDGLWYLSDNDDIMYVLS